MKQPKPPLVVLTGPTAVGKTDLSIRLAKRIGGEIISADSMQVYRGMDIGTAKISEEEKQGVPHFLLDELEPWEEFHVALFQQKAKQYIKEIYGRGHIPILVGGTGFYIQSVLYDIDFKEPVLEEERDIRTMPCNLIVVDWKFQREIIQVCARFFPLCMQLGKLF